MEKLYSVSKNKTWSWLWLRSSTPYDWKIKPINPKESQPWIFIGRTDAEAEALILWPPDVKRWLTGKDSDAGKDWKKKEERVADDQMIRQHYQLNG